MTFGSRWFVFFVLAGACLLRQSSALAGSLKCEDSDRGSSINYSPYIQFKDPNTAWVIAKTITARKKECWNSCQQQFGEDGKLYLKAIKSDDSKVPSLMGLNNANIDPNAKFECRIAKRKWFDDEQFPEGKNIAKLQSDMAKLPPSASTKEIKTQIESLEKSIEQKAGDQIAKCPTDTTKAGVSFHTEYHNSGKDVEWVCAGKETLNAAAICPQGMTPLVESGLSSPWEETNGGQKYVYMGLVISCANEACPKGTTAVDHICVSCPKETALDLKESKAAVTKGSLSDGFYLCSGKRSVIEKLYKEL